jgi:hypothetical protein
VADADNRHLKLLRFSRKSLTDFTFLPGEIGIRILNAQSKNRAANEENCKENNVFDPGDRAIDVHGAKMAA